jgi:hypothetical protein
MSCLNLAWINSSGASCEEQATAKQADSYHALSSCTATRIASTLRQQSSEDSQKLKVVTGQRCTFPIRKTMFCSMLVLGEISHARPMSERESVSPTLFTT